ncbi:hypothetical protein ABMA27_016332 [Loxostege sticticalis]|uniref:CHK kinase-like domain-containing protein n=1 Tax=Loxostege sticticalis TaxID=481309 RepID=A0ABR3I230_LOXSC
MVGGDKIAKQYKVEDILTEKQVQQIVKQYVPEEQWQLVDCIIKPASDGLAGFLGDHLKMSLNVMLDGRVKTIHLFIKRMPHDNKPKADFIDENNYYRREKIMFQLFDKIRASEGPNPWCPKALICNESILVLPDLNEEGYSPRPYNQTLDLAHVLVTTASLARFHAAFANYEVKRSIELNQPNCFFKEHEHTMKEPTLVKSPWLSAAAKLTANILKAFSKKIPGAIPDLEEKIYNKFLEACDSLKYHDGTLNVVLHKDLWANNIMFRYENGLPANAMLIDFQLIRYGPPSFDLMSFLYLTTSRSFREQHERKVLHYYYCVFSDSLEDAAKQKATELGFVWEKFLQWCEQSRMFGICAAIGYFPYVLMDPVTAQKTFDDPATYEKYLAEDRTEPVVAYANIHPIYKNRQIEVAEEFVERYVLNQPR